MHKILILPACCLVLLSVAACGREEPTRTFSQPEPEPQASPGPNGTATPPGRGPTTGSTTMGRVDVSGVEKAEGGMTVGELFARKAELAGKEVTLRAKVVKFTPQVMGKNWLHVQDGSGDAKAATHDLTVTTNVTAKVGDTVLITGPVTLEKDFGAGYRYDVIIEDAKVTAE